MELKRVQTLFAPSVPSSSDFPITLLNQPNEKLIDVNNGLIIIQISFKDLKLRRPHTSQMRRLKVVSNLQSVIKEKAKQTCETWGTNVMHALGLCS